MQFSRAGHCPTLYYSKRDKVAQYFQNKGLGLGILRNDSFRKFIHINELAFEKDDILVLYTDGISEASNAQGEEFGYDRMKSLLEKNAHYDPVMIQNIYWQTL